MSTRLTGALRAATCLMGASVLTVLCASAHQPPQHQLRVQDDAGEDEPVCRKCKSTGRKPCSEHPRDECALEDEVLFCSEVAACEECGGTGYVDCSHCANESVQEELVERRKDIARRAVKNTWLAKDLDREVRFAESDHFIVIWEMDGMKVDKQRKSAHEMLHLTARRMEELFALYLEKLEAREGDFAEKTLVAIWYLPSDQLDASARLCGGASKVGVKLYSSKPRYSCCGSKQNFKNDAELHKSLVHNVAHILLSHQRPSYWIGADKKGWADAGFAHWFEFAIAGRCNNYCYEEQNTKRDFKSGKFKVGVRKLVALGKQSSMSSVMQKKTSELTPAEHALAFSYIDYLMQRDGAALNQLLRQLREREQTRDALRDTYDLSIFEFEELWTAWVLETYPTR